MWKQLINKMSTLAAKKAAKAALRAEIKKRIGILTTEEKARQSRIVVDKLLNLPIFKESKHISVFLSIDNEINTEPIVRAIFESNKCCYVPRYSSKAMDMVKLHSMDDWETLPFTKWHIKQPSLKDKRESVLETGNIDLIVMPGVAFTKNGLRMGHGGGYYDRYLQSLKEMKGQPVPTVAVAFKQQIVDDLPIEETDVPIDRVIYTE